MIILGVSSCDQHDPSAALVVDGKIVAAAEEERFNRIKHSTGMNPTFSAKWCLKQAGLTSADVDIIAFPWSPDAYRRGWKNQLKQYLDTPSYWGSILKSPGKHIRRQRKGLDKLLSEIGIDTKRTKIVFVEHHLAHAASSYHLSGFPNAAVLSIDGYGEYTSVLIGKGEGRKITKLDEIAIPDSLGLAYSLVTHYCGFAPNDGEFKVMGMSAYGDPAKADLSSLIQLDGDSFHVDKHFLWRLSNDQRHRRYRPKSRELEDIFKVARRKGDALSEPYVHVAAAIQKILEDALRMIVTKRLGSTLAECDGRMAYGGGTALNVRANGKLITEGLVKQLYVQPAAHDAGISLGAAVYAAVEAGEKLEPMTQAYLGPEYSNDDIESALKRFRIPYQHIDDVVGTITDLLAEGKIVANLQGRMEWGPRALGNRSILANPTHEGISDEVNSRIKFREKWRPFCPSLAEEHTRALLGHDHPSPFMTFSFPIVEGWRDKIGECLHVDGTGRPQTVSREANPLYHDILSTFHKKTGTPAILNTSLNRRGEPMVCSPEDAIAMFYGCGLEYLVMGNFLVRKSL